MNAIRLENITKSYGSNLVLNNFSMSINSGEFVAIKGASGSGKSTILNILGLMENFDSGKYYLFDKMMSNCDSVQNIKILRNDVSYLFQNFALINDKTVLDNLKIAIRFLNISKKEKELPDLGMGFLFAKCISFVFI